ncbi:MAG: hypothetical protein U9Q83_04330 [Bacteroidota bacterium]|nr:hypothetical protein [Bacteroidota bacterium]
MAFLKLPGHYVFDYKPMFYDPKKEEREKRVKRIKQELGVEVDKEYKHKPSFDFKRPAIYRKRRQRISAIRFVAILAFIMIIVYFFLFTHYFDVFIEKIIR